MVIKIENNLSKRTIKFAKFLVMMYHYKIDFIGKMTGGSRSES